MMNWKFPLWLGVFTLIWNGAGVGFAACCLLNGVGTMWISWLVLLGHLTLIGINGFTLRRVISHALLEP